MSWPTQAPVTLKLRSLFFRLLLLAALLLAAAQWWVLREGERVAQQLIAQWQAYGTLRYEHLWVNLWGSVRLRGVSFEPAGLSQAMLGTPLGYRIGIREVRLYDPAFNARGELKRIRLQLRDLELPMEDGYRLRARNAPPSLAAMGYQTLLLQSELQLRVVEVGPILRLVGDLQGEDSGALKFDLWMRTSPQSLRMAPDQVALERLQLDYRDRGLMPRYLDRRASDLGVRAEAAPAAVVALLDQRARKEKWRWDAASAEALRNFIRDPAQGFRAELEPPGVVRLRDLNLYAVGDWPPLLGFRMQAPP